MSGQTENARKALEGFTIGLTFGLAAVVYAIRDKRTAAIAPEVTR